MKNIFSFILISFTTVIAFDCLTYTCDTTIDINYPCAKWERGGMELRLCPGDMICPIPQNYGDETYCKDINEIKYLYAGEYCNSTTQCLNNLECKLQYCRLKAPNDEDCKSDGDCDVESFCKKGECVDAGKGDEDCKDGDKCRTSSVCINEKCVIEGSLEDNADADISALCRSRFIEDNKCTQGYKLIHDKSYKPINGTCKYRKGEKEMFLDTVCGKNDEDNYFCAPGMGDIDTGSIADYFQSKNKIKCHLDKGPFCITADLVDMRKEFLDAYIAYIEMTDPSVLFNPSPCVKTMYHRNYWEAKEALIKQNDNFGFILFIIVTCVVVIGSILMIAIYFIKGRKAPEPEETDEML